MEGYPRPSPYATARQAHQCVAGAPGEERGQGGGRHLAYSCTCCWVTYWRGPCVPRAMLLPCCLRGIGRTHACNLDVAVHMCSASLQLCLLIRLALTGTPLYPLSQKPWLAPQRQPGAQAIQRGVLLPHCLRPDQEPLLQVSPHADHCMHRRAVAMHASMQMRYGRRARACELAVEDVLECAHVVS